MANWLLALAAALPLWGRTVYFYWVPGRAGWWAGWLATAAAVYPAARAGRRLVASRWAALARAQKQAVAAYAAAAVLVVLGLTGRLQDNLWLHPASVRGVLQHVLPAGEAVIAAGLMTLLLAGGRPAPVPRSDSRGLVLPGVIFMAAVNAVGVAYLQSQNTIPYWDYAGHWVDAVGASQVLRDDPAALPAAVAESMRESDYNLLSRVAPAAVMSIISESHTTYVLALLNIYGFATWLSLAWLLKHVDPQAPAGRRGFAALAACAGLPLLWVPAVLGYPGLGGLALASAAVAVYSSRPRPDCLSPSRLVAVGVLIGLMFLFRRWYAYWAVAFFAWAGLAALIRRRPRPALAVGVVSGLVVAGLAWPQVVRALKTDYADIYSAYQSRDGLIGQLVIVRDHLGWATVALIGVAALAACRRRALFAGGLSLLAFGLLLRVQIPGPHHFYLLLHGAAVLVAAAVLRAGRRWPLAAVPALAVGGLVGPWQFGVNLPAVVTPALPATRFVPERRSDRPEFRRMVRWLDGELAEGETFCVLGVTVWFNETHLWTAGRHLGEPDVSDRLRRLPLIDKRDGFPRELLTADVVLVPEPMWTQMDPAETQIQLTAAASLRQRRGVGLAFRRIGVTFQLDWGLTVVAYRRVRPHTPAEVKALSDRLRAAYPDRPFVYSPAGEEAPAPADHGPKGGRAHVNDARGHAAAAQVEKGQSTHRDP